MKKKCFTRGEQLVEWFSGVHIIMLLREVRGSFLRAWKDIDRGPLQISANNCHFIMIVISITVNIIVVVDSISVQNDTTR